MLIEAVFHQVWKGLVVAPHMFKSKRLGEAILKLFGRGLKKGTMVRLSSRKVGYQCLWIMVYPRFICNTPSSLF